MFCCVWNRPVDFLNINFLFRFVGVAGLSAWHFVVFLCLCSLPVSGWITAVPHLCFCILSCWIHHLSSFLLGWRNWTSESNFPAEWTHGLSLPQFSPSTWSDTCGSFVHIPPCNVGAPIPWHSVTTGTIDGSLIPLLPLEATHAGPIIWAHTGPYGPHMGLINWLIN